MLAKGSLIPRPTCLHYDNSLIPIPSPKASVEDIAVLAGAFLGMVPGRRYGLGAGGSRVLAWGWSPRVGLLVISAGSTR